MTGNLEHPGVVPVYGLVHCPDGRPVYAMRFIHGESLHDAIARFHRADEAPGRDPGERRLALRALLGRFVAVCNAVAYAHSKGVIHRDLKPANVMLGEFGETLVVDWGLAKVLGHAGAEQSAPRGLLSLAEDETAPTVLGQVMGTPAFMPPEQARGEHDRVDERSDVWSLGAVLYELLTGRTPYAGQDALGRASRCDFVPPRQAQRQVPKPLEAVCLVAMAREPGGRYPGARALAVEIDRWLADEPVLVYREPVRERVRRWARRRRTLVSSLAVLLCAAVAGLALGLWAVRLEERKTRAALAVADRNLDLAKEAIDECYNVAKEHELFQGPRMEKAKKLLLEKTLPFYQNFQAQRPADRQLQWEEATQWHHVAYIEMALERTAAAQKAYEQALSRYETLAKGHPEIPLYPNTVAVTHNNLGAVLLAQGKREEAIRHHEQARAVLLKLAKARPHDPASQKSLGDTHHALAALLLGQGKREEAARGFEQARALRQRLVEAHPDLPAYQSDLANTYTSTGALLEGEGKHEEAAKEYGLARAIQRRLAERHPGVPYYQKSLALTHNNLGVLLKDQGKREEAATELERARSLRQALVKAHPDIPDYQKDLALTHYNLAALLRDRGKLEEAARQFAEARALLLELVKALPDVVEYQSCLAATHTSLGIVLRDQGKREEAAREYGLARAVEQGLVKAHPDVPDYQGYLARTLIVLSDLSREAGRSKEALPLLVEAISLLEAVRRRDPDRLDYRNFLCHAHLLRALTLDHLGRHREAAADWDKCVDLAAPTERAGHRLLRAVSRARAGEHRRAAEEAEELARPASLPGATLYNLACVQALSAAAAARDPARPLPEREKRAEQCARQAVVLLERAAAAGFFRDAADLGKLGEDPDLAFLRPRDDFRALTRSRR